MARKYIPWISHIDCHMGCGSCAPATGHPGYEDVAADRDAVTRVFTSKAVMEAIRERNISLVNYREAAGLKR